MHACFSSPEMRSFLTYDESGGVLISVSSLLLLSVLSPYPFAVVCKRGSSRSVQFKRARSKEVLRLVVFHGTRCCVYGLLDGQELREKCSSRRFGSHCLRSAAVIATRVFETLQGGGLWGCA